MAPKSIAARREMATMMASKALISKAIAARASAAKALAAKKLEQNQKANATETAPTSTTDISLASVKFREFEKVLIDTFNPKPKKSPQRSETTVTAKSNTTSQDAGDNSFANDTSVEKNTEISVLPSLNAECTVEAVMYPFKLVLTPQEQRPLETSIILSEN